MKTHSPKTRLLMVNAFKKAKENLKHHDGDYSDSFDKTTYICNAILFSEDLLSIHDLCVGVISDRLGGNSTLEGWLVDNGIATLSEIRYDENCNNMKKIQATRHAWIDSLIEEFSS